VVLKKDMYKAEFVGRKKEIQEFQNFLEDAKKGLGRLIFIEGEVGIGKTRLGEEFSRFSKEEDVWYIQGQGLHSERADPFLPIIDALRNFFHTEDAIIEQRSSDDPPLMSRIVLGSIYEQGSIRDSLLDEFDSERRPVSFRDLEAIQRERDRIFDNLGGVFDELSSMKPVVLFLDDLHWADNSTLQFLRYLARRIGKLPMVVYGTYRPEDLHDVEGEQAPLVEVIQFMSREKLFTHTLLARLTKDEVAQLVRSFLGRDEIPDSFIDPINEKSEGNPFFVEEVLLDLLERGVIDPKERDWPQVLDPQTLSIPDTLKDVIWARVKRLTKFDQKVLRYAAIIGRRFHFTYLQELLDADEDELLDAIDDLLALRIILEDTDTDEEYYRFENSVMWDLIYNELSRSRQRALHLKVGEVIEKHARGKLDDVAFDLVFHFDRGKNYQKAVKYGIHAGDLATDSKTFVQAQKVYTIGLEAFDELSAHEKGQMGEEGEHLLEGLGGASMVLGDWKVALKCFDRILKEAKRTRDSKKEMDVHLNIGYIKRLQGEWANAQMHYKEALELGGSLNDGHAKSVADRGLGYIHWRKGEYSDGIEHFQSSLAEAKKGRDEKEVAVIQIEIGNVHLEQGEWQKALGFYKKSRKKLQEVGELFELLRVINNIGDIHMKQRKWKEAIKLMEECKDISDEAKSRFGRAWAQLNLSECYANNGDLKDAVSNYKDAISYFKESGSQLGIAIAIRNRAIIHRFKKEWEMSKSAFEEAVSELEKLDVRFEVGYTYGEYTRMLIDQSRPKAAKKMFDKAVKTISEIGAQWYAKALSEDMRDLI